MREKKGCRQKRGSQTDADGRTDRQRRERPGGRAGGVRRERGGPGGADWLRAAGGGARGDGLPGRPQQRRGFPLSSPGVPGHPALRPVLRGPPRGDPPGGARTSRTPARAPSPALTPARIPGARGGGQVLACASPSRPAPGPRFRRPGADGRRPARLPARGRVCSDGRGSQSRRGRGKPAPAGNLPWALRPGTQDPPALAPPVRLSPPPSPARRCLLPGPGRAEPVA